MLGRKSDTRRRSSLLTVRRVNESAVKSTAKKPTGGAGGGPSGAGGATAAPAAGAGSTTKSRLPRPSSASAVKRPSAAASLAAGLGVVSAGGRASGRLSSVTPQSTRQRSAGRAGPATASKFSAGRASMDPSRRASHGSGIGTARGRCPDPRPIGDKEFMLASMQRVVTFLNEKQCRGRPFDRPTPITCKELSKCSGREFDAIFTFLYGFFDQSVDLQKNKREVLVPQVMKTLGYPGQLSKSNLLTIGCPHSWPQVLAALSWLVELIELVFGADVIQAAIPTVEVDGFLKPNDNARLLLDHSLRSYHRFMCGVDTTPEQGAAELRQELAKLDGGPPPDAEIQQLEAENKHLQETLGEVVATNDGRRAQLTELSEQAKAMELDLRRMDAYIANRNDKCREHERDMDRLDTQLAQRKHELELMEQHGVRLRQQIESQELSADDVSKIAHQTAAVLKQVEERRAEIREIEHANGDVEMELQQREARLEAELRQLAAQLLRLPALADQQQLMPRLRAPQAEHVQQLDALLQHWTKAERQVRLELERGNSALLHLEGSLRELRGTVETSGQELTRMQGKLRRLEEEDGADRAQSQHQRAQIDAQLAEVDARISRLTAELNQLKQANSESERKLDAKKQLYTGLKDKMEKQHENKLKDVHEMAALTLELKQHLDSERARVARGMQQIYDETVAEIKRRVERHDKSKSDKSDKS